MKHIQLDDLKRKYIIGLKKKSIADKQDFYLALSKAMDVSSRNFPAINVYRLNKIAKKNPNKIYLIPGNLLGYGDITSAVKVYAYKVSKNAEEKIKAVKGSVKDFDELLKSKLESKDIMIVK